MTEKWMLEPIDKEKLKEEWNNLMKNRTKTRRLNRDYPTPVYHGKLEIYKHFFESEVTKVVIQYLKGKIQ